MATFVLIPGAGGAADHWQLVVPLLRRRGHEAIAVELPGADPAAGLPAYAELANAAAPPGAIVVGQSLGAYTAPLVAHAAGLVLVCPMIPSPGETAGEWWDATGQEAARRAADLAAGRDPDAPFDPAVSFLHDVDLTRITGDPGDEVGSFADPWPLDAWPAVPTRVLVARHDRFFPLEFARRISRERLAIEPDVIDSGHLPALAKPDELAAYLLAV